ncbi:MAG: thioredoxin domain-containing protein [Solirubrobacteraceae bacterium]
MANALADEHSPYLRQHADNPVDWLPWGEQALARARERDAPLLVSIGYSACHWCHVMERECFEDQRVAAAMNENFVCVKVDREERPDLDAIYMEAVQAMTGQGGWPLNVFLTPAGTPFYGGTYFPPQPRHGMPSWPQVLGGVAQTWKERRAEAVAAGARLTEQLNAGALLEADAAADNLRPESLASAQESARALYDSLRGGFGAAPKFPPASLVGFLLACGEREMSLATLRAMASGGINDQVGGGFARYSVDADWTVPHFEKMLYDNALLARSYLHGWLASGDEKLLRVCRETLDFCLRELRAPEGGFFCALDADSEGVEGRFYVWSVAELRAALGPELCGPAIAYFGASEGGNFERANVLEARGPEPAEREEIRARLLAVRAERVRPALDDKQLCSWNALAVSALAEAGATLRDGAYLDAARACAEFVLVQMRDGEGRLLRTPGRLRGYLEDHAFLLEALLTLYEATWEERWFVEARALAEEILLRFADPERGGFFSTADDHERLIVRRKDLEDSPIPSGPASAAFGLLRLAALTGEHRYADAARRALLLVEPLAARHPASFGHTLQAILFAVSDVREVALVGKQGLEPLLRAVRGELRPALVLAGSRDDAPEGSLVPLLEGRTAVDGRAAAYVCTNFVCQAPTVEPEDLRALL